MAESSPYAGGVQVGSPETPFKINDIHSMHVVEVLVYTHLLALKHINYQTEIDIPYFLECFSPSNCIRPLIVFAQQSGLNVYCVRPRIVFARCSKGCACAIAIRHYLVRYVSIEV